jgi:Niemann-Pick C1 protein
MFKTSEESPAPKKSFSAKVEDFVGGGFYWLGANYVGTKPKLMIALCFLLTVIIAGPGFAMWETENRQEKLWVPQDTQASQETLQYESRFPRNARFNSMIVQGAGGANVLTKESLEQAMNLHLEIETEQTEVDGDDYVLIDLCSPGGGCVSGSSPVCFCLIQSILKYWNYDLATLQNDTDVLGTINMYAMNEKNGRENLESALGSSVFGDETGEVVSAEAFTMSYFLKDQAEFVDGDNKDPINEGWEEQVFLKAAESAPENYPLLEVDYFATRSFGDEFGGEISGDLLLVQISYVVAFLYLGANLGAFKCGTGSRWTMAFSGVMVVALSTGAGFGLSSIFGLFFGPVHAVLPFVLLGIGVDDGFVIANAFNRERTVARKDESNEDIALRAGRALRRAGASITVTSSTDMVAFGISASSSLPALASFCGYAAVSIFFLWLFAAVFFSATFVLDERRQRDNRRECLCCMTRKTEAEEEVKDNGFEEGRLSAYFRDYHAPAILSKVGKPIVTICFAGLLGFGIWGAMNLAVEDSERDFIPKGSYVMDYFEAADEYYPSTGINLAIVFEGEEDIYKYRQNLADLDSRLSNKSEDAPYIAEPSSSEAYKNVMEGLSLYLNASGSASIGNVSLGDDNWPTTQEDFVIALKNYTSFGSPGSADYAQDVSMSDDGTTIEAIKIQAGYVRLTKLNGDEMIDDADRQIEAMDDTRAMVSGWEDLPSRFVYSVKFIAVEGFKTIQKELFFNVGLAVVAVGLIMFLTIGSIATSLLITLNVAMCIIEILGFMHAFGIVIDSVSVINTVLAVGLSVDYSAHIGHSFMTKRGDDKNARTTEALADMGPAVLSGAISTFLAVVVLLFSSSYVFVVLSTQFALTVGLGILHGLLLLPVMLSVLGPTSHESEEESENPKTTQHGETMDVNEQEVAET